MNSYTKKDKEFKLNKQLLKKVEDLFVRQDKTAKEIMEDLMDEYSNFVDDICSDFDMFDNSHIHSSMGAGVEDVRAFASAIMTRRQSIHARNFKNDTISEGEAMVRNNDKLALFRKLHSINRSAKANLNVRIFTENAIGRDIESFSSSQWNWCKDFEAVRQIKAGNRQKRRKKSKQFLQSSFDFDFGSIA